jgi:hypothetical protein
MYGFMPEITEKVHSLEWAFVAPIAGGTIPEKHRLVPTVQVLNPVKFDTEIFNQATATQAYDNGLERFVGKYDSSIPMTAVMAIEKGVHDEYGLSIFFQQEKRRCLLLETLTGSYTETEAFWYTMMMWDKFHPRSATPRMEPGQLYCPSAATHIIEKYWDYLNDPCQHPDCSESDFTKAAMSHFAAALSSMDLSSFEPAVDAGAKDKSCRIATQAALSRRLPIQDAVDFWAPRRESADTGDASPGQDRHNVDT